MALRTLSCLAGLLFSALAAAQDGSSQLEEAIKEKETLTKQIEALKAQLADKANDAPVDLPLSIMNSAGNNVTLANCFESHELQAGEEIATTFLTGGLWILPDSSDFNCSTGCEDCFYVTMQWSEIDGPAARIGFGTGTEEAKGSLRGADRLRPLGGGLKLSVSGAVVAQCTDESCQPGWTDPVAVNPDGSAVGIVIEGSKRAEPAPDDGAVSIARARYRGRRHRRYYRRPVRRRPVTRRPVDRRPVYRPSPGWPRRTPGCAWCNQHGSGTCWWLC